MARERDQSAEQPAAPSPAQPSPHPALKLRHTLPGHAGNVLRMALSPEALCTACLAAAPWHTAVSKAAYGRSGRFFLASRMIST